VTTPRKTRVAVVFGGRSSEHAISCVSAGSILAALDPDQYEVVPVGITREGRWVLASGDPAQLSIADRRLPEITASSGTAVVLPADPTASGLMVVDPADGVGWLTGVDVVFPALHGAYGEDGTVQGMLEMAGIPYVGANVFASAAAMDKEFTKKLAAAEGIPIGSYAVLRAGCSLSEADKIDPKVLVEAAIVGREIECGVLEGEAGGSPETSLLAEIHVSGHDFYDFEAKYLEGSSYDLPAVLPADVTRQVREYARRTFTALDCAGLARVDFFVTPELDIYLNEINTMPGFTPFSMFPQMWAASGLEYPKLVSRLIRTALRRGTGLH
jgi:D-alanine-D-alanine ligase